MPGKSTIPVSRLVFFFFCSILIGGRRRTRRKQSRHIAAIPGHLSPMNFPSAHPVYTCRIYPVALLQATEYLLMPVRDQRTASVQTCQLVAPQWLRTRTGTVGPCSVTRLHVTTLLLFSLPSLLSFMPLTWHVHYRLLWKPLSAPLTSMFYTVYARRDLGKLDFSIAAKANDFKRNDSSVAGGCKMLNNVISEFLFFNNRRLGIATSLL